MRRMERLPGDDVGGYTVVRTLGRGGSGAVYLVRDQGGGEAALKLLDRSDAGARARLAREVAALQALRHPAVPRVWDAELDDDEAFVVFEYVAGPSLAHRVHSRGPLPRPELARVATALADALAAVHAAGVVHRDVTPSNVLLGPHGPVLIDFGLSHHHEDERLTQTGLVSGTAGYVAPEVIDGADPSPASDDWALAATLAFAATGKAPFGTGRGALSATLAGDVLPDVPLALARALTAAPPFRPRPRDLARALEGGEETAVLGVAEVGVAEVEPTLVAYAWDHEDATEGDEQGDWDEEPLPRELPRRRGVLVVGGLALVALATVAPFIAAGLALLAAVMARAVESAARGVRRSRERRGVQHGGIAAQILASPWHVVRALVLTLPSALVAAASAGAVGWLGWHVWSAASDPTLWRAAALALAGAVGVVLLGWGPRGAEARRGAHLVAASVTPTARWSAVGLLVGSIVVVVCVGIATAGTRPLWWPR